MRRLKIELLILENFAGIQATMHTDYVKLDLRNTKNRICLITGPNGHGKTVLLSQLNPFATLGTLDERDALPLIIEGKNGKKHIVISNGQDIYEITHFYMPNKATHSVKSYIQKNGTELNPNGNVTSFKEVVKEELSMEQEYMKLVRLGNNVINLIDLKSAERKTFMSKILEDANVYLRYFKKINTEVNTLKTLITHVTDKIRKTNISNIDVAKEDLQKLEEKLSLEKETLEHFKEESSILQYELSSIPDTIKKEMTDSYQKLDKLKKKLAGNASLTLESLEKETNRLEKTNNELSMKITVLSERLNNMITSFDNHSLEYNQVSEDVSKLENQLDVIGLETTLSDVIKELHEKEEVVLPYLEDGSLPEYRKKEIEDLIQFLRRIEVYTSTIYELGDRPIQYVIWLLKNGKDPISYLDAQEAEIEEEVVITNAKLAKSLRNRFTKVATSCNKNCPMIDVIDECFRDTPKDQDDVTLDFLEDCKKAYNVYQKIMHSFVEEKELFTHLPKYLKDQFLVKTIQKRLQKGEMIYNRDLLQKELSFITTYENMEALKQQKETIEKEIEEAKYSSTLSLFQKKQKALKETMKKEKETISSMRSEKELLQKKKEEISESLEEASSLYDILLHREELETSYEEKKSLYEKKVQLLEKDATLLANIQYKEREILLLDTQVNTMRYNLKTAKEQMKELKVYQKYYDDWILLKESLSSNTGIPLVFIDLYLKSSLEVVNKLLDEIYHGSMYVQKFNIQSNEFTIPFYKNGTEISDIRYASQGEKSFFSITLSFAISFKSMTKYNIMLLDEIDSVLDESNRTHFIAICEQLLNMIDAEQMFVISHNNMFSMYPVDVISVINKNPEDHQLANYIPLKWVKEDTITE